LIQIKETECFSLWLIRGGTYMAAAGERFELAALNIKKPSWVSQSIL